MPAPYAGNQASYPASVDILSGSDLPNTTNFNTAWEGGLDRTAFLNGAIVANAGCNWPRLVNPNPWMISVGSIIWSACWDPFNEFWICGSSYDLFGTATVVYNYSFNGRDWGQIDTVSTLTNQFPIAMAVDGLGTHACVRSDFTSTYHITVQTQPHAVVNVAPTGSGTWTPGQGVMVYFAGDGPSQWMFQGASGILGVATVWTGMAVHGQVTGAGPPPVTAWINDQTLLPANWSANSGSGNMVFAWLAAIDESFPLAGDATQVVFGQCGFRHGVDSSYLLHWVGTSSTVYTDITPSFLASGSYQLRGLAYSPVDQLWGMVVTDGDMNGHGTTPANSYFLTSPDLVTWTSVFTFFDFMASGLACNGNVWSMMVCETLYTDQTSNRILFSNNVSLGVLQSWEAADYTDNPSMVNLAPTGYSGRIYMGNSGQFFTAYPFGGVPLPAPQIAYAGASSVAINGLG